MRVVAIPNRRYPPPDDALQLADVVVGSLAELTPAVVAEESVPGATVLLPAVSVTLNPAKMGSMNVPNV